MRTLSADPLDSEDRERCGNDAETVGRHVRIIGWSGAEPFLNWEVWDSTLRVGSYRRDSWLESHVITVSSTGHSIGT